MAVSASLDFDTRASTLDQLLPLARRAFAMTSDEVTSSGCIRTPFMMTLGDDGFDMGRLHTDRPLDLLAASVKKRGRPGVVAFTEGARLVLGLVDGDGVLARVNVPFVGRRFEAPVSIDVDEVFDERYQAPRLESQLLPLQAPAPGEESEAETPKPVNPFDGVSAQALADVVKVVQQQRDQLLFAMVDPRTLAEAPLGVIASWMTVQAHAFPADFESTNDFMLALAKADHPVLRALHPRIDLEEAERLHWFMVDPEQRLDFMGALRVLFMRVEDGNGAREELNRIFRQVVEARGGLHDEAVTGLEQVASFLDLRGQIRGLVGLVVFAVVGLVVLGGLGLGGLYWLFA